MVVVGTEGAVVVMGWAALLLVTLLVVLEALLVLVGLVEEALAVVVTCELGKHWK
jgi:hypothetical protein